MFIWERKVAMGSVRRHASLNATAQEVWDFIGRPGALHEWFPITATRIEGLRRFQYGITNNPLITSHLGTYDVIELTPTTCIVVYSTNVEPEVFALAIGAAAGEGMRFLEKKYGIPKNEGNR
jgi:hypothetical protein